MTRNEIEYMWKVASNDPNHDTNWNDAVVIAFAKLVAEHERERFTDAAMKAAEKGIDTAIALEREACAKVCESMNNYMDDGEECATAIRARGQA
jgi:hypothetical protein